MTDIIINHLSKLSIFSLLLRSYLTVLILGIIDYLSGPYLLMLVFYLIPIIIVSWFVGKKAGFAISAVSAGFIILHDLLFLSPGSLFSPFAWILPIWNTLVLLSVFIIVSQVISSMKRSQDEKIRCELQLAVEVQTHLLPRKLPRLKTLDYAVLCKPISTVSGDYYDFMPVNQDKLGIAVGDICGKGISAAMLMANLQGVLRSHASRFTDNIHELMGNVNKALYGSTDASKFATLFYGIYDDSNRTLTYTNAGHTLPLILRKKNGQTGSSFNTSDGAVSVWNGGNGDSYDVLRIGTGDTVLGAFADAAYTKKTIHFKPGDTLIIFTDGISEARNYMHEQYGEERLISFAAGNLHETPQKMHDLILNDVKNFIGEEAPFDDMTLVVARVN